MKKIDVISEKIIFKVLENDCPSNWGLKDTGSCSFREEGIIDNRECLECWLQEVED